MLNNFIKSETKIDLSSPSNELLNLISSELDSIDSESMLENLVKLLNSISEDVSKKFTGSKYANKIQEIFDKNFETIVNYFLRVLQHTDNVKVSVKGNITEGLSQLNQIVQSECEDITDKIVKQVNSLNPKGSGFVYDEEFVALINSLSASIKDFMKSCKSLVKHTITNLENSVDSLLIIKNSISEFEKKDKNDKNKIHLANEKIDEWNEIRINCVKNVKNVDDFCGKFYDEAKVVFKKLKKLHNEKLSEIQKMNEDFSRSQETNEEFVYGNYSAGLKSNNNKFGNFNYSNNAKLKTSSNNKNNYNSNNQNRYSNSNNNLNTSNSNNNNRYANQHNNLNSSGANYQNRNLNSSNSENNYDSNNVINSYNTNPNINKINNTNKPGLKRRADSVNLIRRNKINNYNLTQSSSKDKDHNTTANCSFNNFTSGNNNISNMNISSQNFTNPNNISNTSTNLENSFNYLSRPVTRGKSAPRVLNKSAEMRKSPSVNQNQKMNNLNLSNDQIQKDKSKEFTNLKNRNSELLNEIASLHAAFLSLQKENSKLIIENENLKNEEVNHNEESKHNKRYNNNEEDNSNKEIGNNSKSGNNIVKNSNSENNSLFSKLKTSKSMNNTDIGKSPYQSKVDSLFKLSEMVVLFIRQMSNLQDAISQKANNVKDMKKDFEMKKKDLVKFANEIKVVSENNTNDNLFNLTKENNSSSKNTSNIQNIKNQLSDDNIEINNNEGSAKNQEISNFNNQTVFENLNVEKIPIIEIFSSSKNQNKDKDKENNQSNNTNDKENNQSNNTLSMMQITKLTNEFEFERENLNSEIENLKTQNSENIKKFESLSKDLLKSYEENNRSVEMNKELNLELTKIKTENSQLSQQSESLKTKNSEINSKNTSQNELIKTLKQETKSLKEEIANLTNSSKTKSKEDNINDTKLKSQAKEIKDLKESRDKLQITQTENEEEIKNNKSRILALEEQNKFLLQDRSDQIAIYSSKVEETKSQLNKTNEYLKESQITISTLEDKIESQEKTIENSNEKIESLEKTISEFKKRVKELEKIEDTLKKNISEQNKKIENSQNVISGLEKENTNLKEKETKTKINNDSNESKKYKTLVKENQTLNTKLNELEKQNSESEEKLANIIKDNEGIFDEYKNVSNMIKILHNTVTKKTEEILQKENIEKTQNNPKIKTPSKNQKTNLINRSRKQNKTEYDNESNNSITEIDEEEELNNSESNKSPNSINSINNLIKSNNNKINETLQTFITLLTKITKLSDENEESNLAREKSDRLSKKNDTRLNEIIEENRRMKILFDECTATIYEAIRETSPHMLEEMNMDYSTPSRNRDNRENIILIDSKNSSKTPLTPNSEGGGDFISKAVDLFKKYNTEINQENAKFKTLLEESESNMRRYKIMSEEYKSALDLALNRNETSNVAGLIVNTNPNSSLTFTKENVNNFTVDDLVEINATEGCEQNEKRENNVRNKDLDTSFNREQSEDEMGENSNSVINYKINSGKDDSRKKPVQNFIEGIFDNNNQKNKNNQSNVKSKQNETNLHNSGNSNNKMNIHSTKNQRNENSESPTNSQNSSNKNNSKTQNYENEEFNENNSKIPNYENNLNKETNICSKCRNCQNQITNTVTKSNQKELLLEKEKEIEDLIAIQDDLVQKLQLKDEEISSYKHACTRLLSVTDNKAAVPVEKYKILLEQYTEEQERLNEYATQCEVMKRDLEVYKSRISGVEKYDSMSVGTIKIKKQEEEVNYLEDEEELDSYHKTRLNKSDMMPRNSTLVKKSSKENNANNNTVGAMARVSNDYLSMLNAGKEINLNESVVHSVRSRKTSNTYVQEAIKDAISKYEEHEELLAEQLQTIKKELKETREERDLYRRKFEESITLADGKKNEVLDLLKQAVEKLILEITITAKIKEIVSVILRVLDYSEDHIAMIFNSKDKKKNFFNFFNK